MKLLQKLNDNIPDDQLVQEISNPTAMTRRQNYVQMVEDVLLIWLDNTIDNNNIHYQHMINKLQRTINSICTFTNSDECVQFLETIENEKICIIISDTFAHDILSQIHHMSKVDAIFILDNNEEVCEQWTKDWFKIKGIYTKIDQICAALNVVVRQCEQDATSISFMPTIDNDVSNKKLNQLNPSFMYTQILKEILLTIRFNQEDILGFTEYCCNVYENNDTELNNIRKLRCEYHEKSPIWWYTCDSFLHRMLNRALRLLDADIIIRLGFFISDLHRHIERLHKEQFSNDNSNESLILYRGQSLSQNEFQKMQEIKGGLLSFNSFLSTSKNRETSLCFANPALTNPNLIGILFVMHIDHSQSTTPFASVASVGRFGNIEEEILFSMHTVFRIDEVTSIGNHPRLFQVKLSLTSDNDKDLYALSNCLREETEGSIGWDQLGRLLNKMGQPAKAQQVYEILIKQSVDPIGNACFYHQLGIAKYHLGEHKKALKLFDKTLELRLELLSPNHLDIARTYNWLGNVYKQMGEYTKALSSHEKALEIRQQSLPSNHHDIANSYNNIGTVYFNMGQYSKALSYYEMDLEISKQILPLNHPDLAMSYINIGSVYSDIGDYSKALSFHQKALEILQESLPSNHPHLASSYTCLGNVYYDMCEYSEALSFHQKALDIQKEAFASNHADLAKSYMCIGNVYEDMGQYSQALSSHEKALEINKQSLPANHPDLALSYNNIGAVYEDINDYSKAQSYYERALEIGRQSLPTSHPHLEIYNSNLNRIKNRS